MRELEYLIGHGHKSDHASQLIRTLVSVKYANGAYAKKKPYRATGTGAKRFSPIQALTKGISDSQKKKIGIYAISAIFGSASSVLELGNQHG